MKKLLNEKGISKAKLFKIIFCSVFVVVAGYSAFTLASNYADISRLNAQATEASAVLEKQNVENEKIKAILESDNKDDYIEQKAREKGYVKSGETVFYDISSSK